MSVTIVGSHVSPFTRIVRMMCEELGVDFNFDTVGSFKELSKDDRTKILQHNPLGKVPIILDEGRSIFDSIEIASYLINKYACDESKRKLALDLDERKTLTVILGIGEAGTLLFMMKAEHPEIDVGSGYLLRLQKRVQDGLIWLDSYGSFSSDFNCTHIALICMLGWLEKRQVVSLEAYSNLLKIVEENKTRPSVIRTRPRD